MLLKFTNFVLIKYCSGTMSFDLIIPFILKGSNVKTKNTNY